LRNLTRIIFFGTRCHLRSEGPYWIGLLGIDKGSGVVSDGRVVEALNSRRGGLLVAAWVQLLTLIDRIIVLFDERGLMTVDCIIRVDATRAVMREATPGENKQPAYLQVAQQKAPLLAIIER
jgi:hypothetical protein